MYTECMQDILCVQDLALYSKKYQSIFFGELCENLNKYNKKI